MLRKCKKALQFAYRILVIWFNDVTAQKSSQIYYSDNIDDLDYTKPILVYVHFSKSNKIRLYEIDLIRNFELNAYQVILVLNTDKVKAPLEFREYFSKKTRLILRNNIGYDLGAYRDVLSLILINNKQFCSLTFMNNSIFWFPNKAVDFVNKSLQLKFDVYAAMQSNQPTWHLQTYLLGCRTAIGLQALNIWKGGIKNWNNKHAVVSRGELGTGVFRNLPLTVGTLIEPSDLISKSANRVSKGNQMDHSFIRIRSSLEYLFSGLPINPTHAFWEEMIDLGFPGIKKDIFIYRDGQIRTKDIEKALTYLEHSPGALEEVTQFLSNRKWVSLEWKIRKLLKV
jgi:hypothetical protein